jgi:peroxiredoxin
MQQGPRDVDDSIRRHPSSLAPPERHRRFGPWGILTSVVSALVLALTAAVVLTRVMSGDDPGSTVQLGQVGTQAPEFDLSSLDGRDRVQLSALRGRVVVVAFERAGCRDCGASEAALDEAWRQFRHLGVSVMGIRRDVLPVASSEGATPGPWPVLVDPEGETAEDYGVKDEFETFVIDRHGKVVVALAGHLTTSALVAQLTLVVGLASTPTPTASPRETSTS